MRSGPGWEPGDDRAGFVSAPGICAVAGQADRLRRWEPWAPVREHVRVLWDGGASYEVIGRAAGVATMTVHRLLHGEPAKGQPFPRRIRAAHAKQLLAVTSAAVQDAALRRDTAAPSSADRHGSFSGESGPCPGHPAAGGLRDRTGGPRPPSARTCTPKYPFHMRKHGTCSRQSVARLSGGRPMRPGEGPPRKGGRPR